MRIAAPRGFTIVVAVLCAAAVGVKAAPGPRPVAPAGGRGEKDAGKRGGLYTHTYNVRDIVRDAPRLLATLNRDNIMRVASGVDVADVDGRDGAALLTRLILTTVAPESWGQERGTGSVQVLNGRTLEVRADRRGHAAIADLLAALRRLADVAVILDARIYELDGDLYAKEVAPLLLDPNQPFGRHVAALLPIKLLERLDKQKPVAHGSGAHIPSGVSAPFLSWQRAFRYVARPGDPKKEPGRVYGTGLEGLSLRVRPVVSADRRSVDLEITQAVRQLLRLARKPYYLPDGQEAEVEAPVWRKTDFGTTIHVMDGQPFLMPVDYRPPAAGGKERVWLLQVEPRIWNQEEEDAIRKGQQPPPRGAPKKEGRPAR